MHKKVVLIFLVLCLVLTSACSKSEEEIKILLDDANYCEKQEDCMSIGSKCPFGCHLFVNVEEGKKIKNYIEDYDEQCEQKCMNCPDVVCDNNKCKPKCISSRWK